MKTKQDVIYYIEKELNDMGMFLRLDERKDVSGQFIWNKVDRKRAHIRLNPDYYTLDELVMVALHELGHARMYRKYSTREYMQGSVSWHELGAWNIALRESESLGVKFDINFVEKSLASYKVGILEVEGLVNKWKHCFYSQSYA